MSAVVLLFVACFHMSVQLNCRGRSICDVDITVPALDYPHLIEIDKGTSIRFTNRVTQNRAEHTITPLKTSNAVNYFGGLSFYATDLGGLYTQTQVICGNVNCMDAFAVKRDADSPFLTINWPEADYPYYCQFHGGEEKGIIRVGNGAGKEPPVPPNTDPDTEKYGCCKDQTLCAQSKDAGCADEWTVQKASGLGYCEPSDANNCLAGGNGVCRWPTPGVENCQIQGKRCLNGLCVDIDASTPAPGGNPCGVPCNNYPQPTCISATDLSYMADLTQAKCANVAGQFLCQYPKTIRDCSSYRAAGTASCSNGKCVYPGGASAFDPGQSPSPPTSPTPPGPNPFTPQPPIAGCSSANCQSPNQCVNNQCSVCNADCAALASFCTCGVNCGCSSASCNACPTAAPTANPNTPCSNAAPNGFCTSGQRCGLVGSSYSCELIPPCSAAERERECATPGQYCQGSNGVYTCGPRTSVCSSSATAGRCEGVGLQCLLVSGAYVCAMPGQQVASPCSLSNPQGACSQAGYTCNTNTAGQVSCGPPPTQPPAPSCGVTDVVCKDACKKTSVLKCSCAGVECQPSPIADDDAVKSAASLALIALTFVVAAAI